MIAKQQLEEITVNPTVKEDIDVFCDFNDENEEAKPKEVKKTVRKPKPASTKGDRMKGRVSSLYKSKPAVTVRTLTQEEIEEQIGPVTVRSSSGRIIKKKEPMTIEIPKSKKSETVLECDACGEKLPRQFMKQHMKIEHVGKNLECSRCLVAFESKEKLKNHESKEHK